MMEPLALALTRLDYTVDNIDYPSTLHTIEALAEYVYKEIYHRYDFHNSLLHFVGHSLGALIIRILLHNHRPPNLGRVVMIAPPNQGTIVVDFFRRFNFYKRWFGPAGQQLGTGIDGVFQKLSSVDYPCGIIAGDRSIDPWFSWFLFRTANDGKVSVASTKLAGMTDHIVVHDSHAKLPKNPQVIELVTHFLAHGHFIKPKCDIPRNVS